MVYQSGVVINHLSAKDILFGEKVHKDNLIINHILLVGKQYKYNYRYTKTNPCLRIPWQDSRTFIN